MLFCEMLWEGVPVFVRRFDRTGFHPAFTGTVVGLKPVRFGLLSFRGD